MSPTKEWRFPPRNGGEITGFNNAAIDTFKGQRLSSVVREVIQNSLDASKLNEHQPVRVTFKLHKIPKKDAPEITLLRRHLTACQIEAKDQNEVKALKFYDNAISRIDNEQEIKILAIHDSNTTGLTGPTDKNFGAWAALVKGTGVSQKQSDSLGSFGHGSKAPFSLSDIRSVFYLSHVCEGENVEKRFQGKSILQTHSMENFGSTQGTGYFGWASSEDCAPLLDEEVPKWASKIRADVDGVPGTTILVPYFQLDESELPETAISCIGNFFYAIDQGNLVIEIINETTLTRENIREEYYRYRQRLSDERDFIDHQKISMNFDSILAIIEADHEGTQEVPDLDKFDWYIKLLDDDGERKTRVAIARKDGMLIKHNPWKLERFPFMKSFEMFVCINGKRGSELLKRLENPKHDDFEFDRIEEPAEKQEAEKLYERIAAKIRAIVKQRAAVEAEEEKSIGILNRWFKPAEIKDEPGNGVERSKIIKISRTSNTFQAKKQGAFKPGTGPIVTLTGQGRRGAHGTKTTTGGPIPGPGTGIVSGRGKQTNTSKKYIPLNNLRSIPLDGKTVKLVFDNPGEGTHQMIVERVGEEGRDRVLVAAGDGSFIDQVSIQLGHETRQEVEIQADSLIEGFALRASLAIEENTGKEE